MNLTGKLLIAMPGMGDPRFEHSVVLLCRHDESGAMGLIVNKPAGDLRLADLLTQLSIGPKGAGNDMKVHFGGPVEGARGFVLHAPDGTARENALDVNADFALTATLDILEDLALGRGPARALMMLGYSGWAPGQLEAEIALNGWLTTDAEADLVFGLEDGAKWGAALKTLGVDPLSLSASAGRA